MYQLRMVVYLLATAAHDILQSLPTGPRLGLSPPRPPPRRISCRTYLLATAATAHDIVQSLLTGPRLGLFPAQPPPPRRISCRTYLLALLLVCPQRCHSHCRAGYRAELTFNELYRSKIVVEIEVMVLSPIFFTQNPNDLISKSIVAGSGIATLVNNEVENVASSRTCNYPDLKKQNL